MAGSLSNYAERAILDHSTGKVAWTKPTIYVGLFKTLPTEDSVAPFTGEVQIASNAYARRATTDATWASAASTGSSTTTSNILAITFTAATASWDEIVGVGLFDQLTNGNLIWWGPLTAPKTVITGDVFQFGIGALTLSLD